MTEVKITIVITTMMLVALVMRQCNGSGGNRGQQQMVEAVVFSVAGASEKSGRQCADDGDDGRPASYSLEVAIEELLFLQ